MPIPLMRQVFRERRRIALLVGLAYMALRLAGPSWAAHPLPAAGLALGLGALFGAIAVLAPRHRGQTEAVALACLAFAALVRMVPASAPDPGAAAGNPLLGLGVWVGLVALAQGLRPALAALSRPNLRRARFTARAGSRVDIHRLWYELVHMPTQALQSGDPDLATIEDTSLRLGPVQPLTPALPDPTSHTELQILEVEAPFHVRVRATTGGGLMGAPGVSEIFLVDLGPQRLVLLAHEFPAMPVGRAILAWLDDMPGRMLDRRLAQAERRARRDDTSRAGPEARNIAPVGRTGRGHGRGVQRAGGPAPRARSRNTRKSNDR